MDLTSARFGDKSNGKSIVRNYKKHVPLRPLFLLDHTDTYSIEHTMYISYVYMYISYDTYPNV